ncbi:hypothetical protein N8I77_012716 [Diaporthe amygdali]|uniref:Anaphase-promoting complex subunit 11 n=1 Tax=Phomopsis amygdali TaxID=1214568 RepID=A0AAD9VYA1_PHOAM|nr:hypothetical protein N8I77_012716 [Diaporthe amygdali]
MKVKIKKWAAVATWRWDIPEDDVCGICQIHFDGSCPSCRFPGDDCELLSGKCGHNFHKHCISQWIRQESARGQCPMCRQSRVRDERAWNKSGDPSALGRPSFFFPVAILTSGCPPATDATLNRGYPSAESLAHETRFQLTNACDRAAN